MSTINKNKDGINISQLNEDIELFRQVHPITNDMKLTHDGVSRLVMLDRYAFKDTEKKTLKKGDFVVLTIKADSQFPARGYGIIEELNIENGEAHIKVASEFMNILDNEEEIKTGIIKRNIDVLDKPLEVFYEQIAKRNAFGLSGVEESEEDRVKWENKFEAELTNLNFIPAGRVLYGAGSETDVTYFNCYVMPYIADSREGISDHRKEVMEIMSRGGGVGTNGSTLRPRNALARGVNGKSSGAVSWLNDIASLTHLVEQGGSRRGAQMLMMADCHPDIIEFIISKMQNPNILRHIINTSGDEQIKRAAQGKLKFEPLSEVEKTLYEGYFEVPKAYVDKETEEYSEQILNDGGRYTVHNPEFLTGANISVAITHEFMEAVENDEEYALRFPDVENYSEYDMALYNDEWHEVGDVREWERLGFGIKTYRTIKARELWELINISDNY